MKHAKAISVVLPTYKRPTYLSKCLDSLLRQSFQPSEIIVGCRDNDHDSRRVIDQATERSGGIVRPALVGQDDNLAQSLNAAITLTRGELVALTDDDAEFPENWLVRFMTYFEDPEVGGVGGRDNQAVNPGESTKFGKLQWFGRTIGNHHLAIGKPRAVDILKGVNCCFRGDLVREIRVDQRLRGQGNVANWELGVCFAVSRRGYKLIFDPSLQVTHHVGPRQDGDLNCRGGFNGPAHMDAVYNETMLINEHLTPVRRLAFSLWWLCIGTSAAPGVLSLLRNIVVSRAIALPLMRYRCTQQGRMSALVPVGSSAVAE
jgi:GT2 family glycosyltransferase